MFGMPSVSDVRRRALGAGSLRLVPLAVASALLVAGCGWDGPSSGVHAVAPVSVAPGGGSAGGADDEIPLEAPVAGESAAGAAIESPDSTSIQQAPRVPLATLPPGRPVPDDFPRTAAVVGDSLTLSARDEIEAYLEGIGIEVLAVDAAENRRMSRGSNPSPGVDAVERIAGAEAPAPELWVIALGTNDVGALSAGDQFASDVADVVDAIPAGAPILWVDFWIRDRRDAVVAANEVLRAALAGRADTAVADWFSHGDDAGIVTTDGVHLTGDGQYMFAATIAAATVDMFD